MAVEYITRKTEAMTMLLQIGPSALPAIRDAIVKAGYTGDRKAARLLDELRWAIVTPPAISAQIPGIQGILANGTDSDRRKTVETLSNFGEDELPVLAELASGTDTEICEATLAAMAEIGSEAAVRAMSVLLDSENPNLRMVAVQSMGKTERSAAEQFLVRALDDPDEVVAATAIAALQRLDAKNSDDRIAPCLSDPRWRIRAAAAEAVGEMEIVSAAGTLEKLLSDGDPFVVRNALHALMAMSFQVSPDLLVSVAADHPELLPVVAEVATRAESPATVEALSRIYDHVRGAERLTLLAAIEKKDPRVKNTGEQWKAFFQKAMHCDSSETQAEAIKACSRISIELTAEVIDRALSGPHPAISDSTAEVVLLLVCYHYGYRTSYSGEDHGILSYLDGPETRLERTGWPTGRDESPEDIEKKAARAGNMKNRHESRHRALLSSAGPSTGLDWVLAAYLTGRPEDNIDALKETMGPVEVGSLLKHKHGHFALGLMIERIPPDRAKPLVEHFGTLPDVYAAFLKNSSKADPRIVEYLTDERLLVQNLPETNQESLHGPIAMLLAYDSHISLLFPGKKDDEKRNALLNASHPLSKTIGIAACSRTGTIGREKAISMLAHESPWVRRASVLALVASAESEHPDGDRDFLAETLAPMLGDRSGEVRKAILIGLLSKEIRSQLKLGREMDTFRFEKLETLVGGVSFWN